jgi:hypothetical protein
MTACFTCDIVVEYVSLANEFTQDLSDALITPMRVLFVALVGVWIVLQGFGLMIAQTSPQEIIKELLFVMIAALLLSGQGPELVNNVYAASLKMMGAAAGVALQVGSQGDSITPESSTIGGGMEALVRIAEGGVRKVFGLAASIASKARLTNPLPIVYAIALIVPYFLVLIVFFAQVVVSIFRVMMLATLSPFLMLGFAFGWGRGMAISGVKTLLTAFMVLFGATAALAVMLYAVNSLDIGSRSFNPSDVSVLDSRYLLVLAMGWLGTAFMTEATGMANSISGASLNNTSVGVITAGAAGTAIGILSKIKGGAAAELLGGAAGWSASKAAQGAGYGAGIIGDQAERVADLIKKAKKE